MFYERLKVPRCAQRMTEREVLPTTIMMSNCQVKFSEFMVSAGDKVIVGVVNE